MLIVSYDISDNKLRTHFSKYLEKFGHRIQYSIFEIENSPRILKIIQLEISKKFSKRFGESDSIFIFELSASCGMTKYGYAKHEGKDFLIV